MARMGEERGVYRVLVGKPEGKNHWGDLGVDGWIILGWIYRGWDVGIWTGLGWPSIDRQVADAERGLTVVLYMKSNVLT